MTEYRRKIKYLKEMASLYERMNSLLEKIEYWETAGAGVRSTSDIDDMPHGSNNVSSKVESASIEVVELEKELEGVARRICKLRTPIFDVKNLRYRTILEAVYIHGISINRLSEILGLSKIALKKAHRNAVRTYEPPEETE